VFEDIYIWGKQINQKGSTMKKNLFPLLLILLFILSCSRAMTKEKYIDTMAELGCKGMAESTPGAEKVLKDKGVTSDQIMKFRQSTKPEEMMLAANEIIKRVMECRGVKP
jgi:hypothetical protein